MKILVCVSKTPETTTKIRFTADQSELDANGVQYIMNPYDEWYALVRALELKEQHGGSVTILNVGPAANDSTLRKGLAIGADDAVRIDADPKSALEVARQIATHAKTAGYDLLLFGKETINYNGAEVPAMVAELLDLPFISFASKMEMESDTSALLERDIEGGTEAISLDLPFVVSAAKGLAEQRIPNMRGIMMAKRKPLQVVEAAAAEEHSVIVSYELPAEKGSVKLIDPENMTELAQLLREEAKVI